MDAPPASLHHVLRYDTLSVWPPSHPLPPDVTYYPVNGHPNQVHMVYTRVDSQPSKEARSFELIAELRILISCSLSRSHLSRKRLFRPARSIFLRTIECWFDMRYVHPAQISGSWPDTWTPIFNTAPMSRILARACPHVALTRLAKPSEQKRDLPPMQAHLNPDPVVHQHSSSKEDIRLASPRFAAVAMESQWLRTHWHDGTQLLHSTWDHVSNYVVTAVPELDEHIAGGLLPLSMGSRFLPGTCEALTIEQTQFEQQRCWGYVRSPLTSLPLPEPPVQTLPPNFVSDWQEKQKPIFEQRASLAPVMESPLPFSSLPIGSQEKFTFQSLDNFPLFKFSEDAPLLDRSLPSTSPPRAETPEMARTSDGYATTTDEFSHSSSRPISIDAPPEAAWSNYHHRSPTITSPVIQPRHIAQPFFDLRVSGTFTFDVSRAIPYFDFSHHLSPLPPVGIELDVIPQGTTAMSFPNNPQEMNGGAWPPPQQLSFDQGVQIQQAPRDTASRPQEVVSNPLPHQPFSPAEQGNSATGDTATPSSTGAKMSVDSDGGDDSSSDSGSSDSSDTDMDSDSDSSSSGDDSDSDSGDLSEDENDAVATETVCKTSSRPPDASSKAQDDVQGVPTDKDKVGDSDSDDDEYTPTLAPAPGASNNNASSSSDEDMSDHEEEDRLYWEKFYTPRHRRQPKVSGSRCTRVARATPRWERSPRADEERNSAVDIHVFGGTMLTPQVELAISTFSSRVLMPSSMYDITPFCWVERSWFQSYWTLTDAHLYIS
ncbi:hypothetical protein EDB85DRAFT_1888563 [Lactarius pseudohatsudake]|nr:hypothetical protein EDB85DRAFT_1888563 [Lactarius pseudohatsudake]